MRSRDLIRTALMLGLVLACFPAGAVALAGQPELVRRNTLQMKLVVDESFSGTNGQFDGSKIGHFWRVTAQKNEIVINLKLSTLEGRQGRYFVDLVFDEAPAKYLIPANMGMSIVPQHAELELNWPYAWEAAFVAAEIRGGVVAIWSRDTNYPFKKLKINRDMPQRVSLEIFNSPTREVESVWVIRRFANWEAAVDAFRQEVLDLNPVTFGKNAQSVKRVINFRLDGNLEREQKALDDLTAQLEAKSTLLYLPLWRQDRFDANYPDYSPKPYLGKLIDHAHQLGFRVMLHLNEDFVNMNSPDKERFWPHRLLEMGVPACTEPRIFSYPGHPERTSFRVKRNTPEWISLMLQTTAMLNSEFAIDGVHLDVSRGIPPGCDDSMIEGTRKLHVKMKEAFPNLILSGEYTSEIARAGLDIYQGLPVERAERLPIRRGGNGTFHPVSLRLFAPARVYSHLHAARDDAQGAVMQEFRARVDKPYKTLILDSQTIVPARVKQDK